MNCDSKNLRAPASSPGATIAASSQATSSGAGGRPQPMRKARRLGARAACDQPGSVSKATSWYCAVSAPAGAGGLATGGEGGLGGSGVHAAASRINAKDARLKMWVIYLEVGVALTLVVLIVWWTWPKNK